MTPRPSTNRHCIYTVITGGYDQPRPQPKIPGTDFLLLHDGNTKNIPAPWRGIKCEALVGSNAQRRSRHAKLVVTGPVEEYDTSIYIDGNVCVRKGIRKYSKWPMAMFRHPSRSLVSEELAAVVALKRDTKKACGAQRELFRMEGFLRVERKFPLTQNRVIFRQHTSEVLAFCEQWFYGWDRLPSCRDQLALQYCEWKYGFRVHCINVPHGPEFSTQPHKRQTIDK